MTGVNPPSRVGPTIENSRLLEGQKSGKPEEKPTKEQVYQSIFENEFLNDIMGGNPGAKWNTSAVLPKRLAATAEEREKQKAELAKKQKKESRNAICASQQKDITTRSMEKFLDYSMTNGFA